MLFFISPLGLFQFYTGSFHPDHPQNKIIFHFTDNEKKYKQKFFNGKNKFCFGYISFQFLCKNALILSYHKNCYFSCFDIKLKEELIEWKTQNKRIKCRHNLWTKNLLGHRISWDALIFIYLYLKSRNRNVKQNNT